MIRYFRESVQGNVAKIFVVLICVPFVLVGVDSFFSGSGEQTIVKVNGEKITEAQLAQESQRLLQQLMSRQGDAFDPTSVDEAALRPTALDNLVQQALLKQAVDDAGLAVSDTTINKAIIEQTIFHQDGKFSADMYRNILRSNNLTPRYYKSLVAQDLQTMQLNSAYASSQFITDKELAAWIALEYETRDLSYIVVDAAKIAADLTVSDAQVEQYYDENKDLFRSDETVSAAYIELKIEDFFEPVPESEIVAAYKQQAANMQVPTQRKAAHILIEFDGKDQKSKAMASLQEAKARIDAGEDFAALAKALSDDSGSANSGGELGYTTGELFPKAFEQALAALDVGAVSEPIETDAGLHLIKLLDVQSSELPSLADMRDQITSELQRINAQSEFVKAYEELKDMAFDNDDIAFVASALNQPLQSSGHFARDGANSGLFSRSGLADTAFTPALKTDRRISDLIELSGDHYLVMQVSDVKPSEQLTLNAVRGQVASMVKQEAVRAKVAEQASAIAEQIEADADMGSVAEQFGLELNAFEGVSRREPQQADIEIINAGFNTAPDQVIQQPLRDGSVAVVQTGNITPGSMAALDSQTIENLRAVFTRMLASADAQAYQAALREDAKISGLAQKD